MTNNQYDLSPDNVARMVTMVFGKMADGNPFWCIVAIKPSCIQQVSGLIRSKTLDLTTFVDDGFGEIVVSGEGLMPPTDVLKSVAKLFNVPLRRMFDHFNMDEVINKEIEELKKRLGVE